VRHLWLFVHLLSIVMWLGGALGAMAIGLHARGEPRDQLNAVARSLAVLYRRVILPGAVIGVASGLVLTLVAYGGPGAMATISHWLMAMQGAGLVAGPCSA
jgi:hypothetical protein